MKSYNFLPQRYAPTGDYKTIKSYQKLFVLLVVLNLISYGNLYALGKEEKKIMESKEAVVISSKLKEEGTVNYNYSVQVNESNKANITNETTELTATKRLMHLDAYIKELKTLKAGILSINLNDRNIIIELKALEKEQYFNIITMMDNNKHLKLVSLAPLSSDNTEVHFKVVLEDLNE